MRASVIPAKAGIHPLPPLDAGLAGMTNRANNPVVLGGLQIHTLLGERKLMDAS